MTTPVQPHHGETPAPEAAPPIVEGPAMIETGWIIDGDPEAVWSWPAPDDEE